MLFRALVRSKYILLLVGFFLPALTGIPMLPHRLLPFYPFVFVGFAWWVRSWIVDRSWVRRSLVIIVIGLFITGNAVSWYQTTVAHPRMEYETMQTTTETIAQDMTSRRMAVQDIGVHYFRPDDQYDYFAPSLYALLRSEIQYPVSYVPLGNEFRRGQPETHRISYLVCDGFTGSDDIPGCIHPFLERWPAYEAIQKYTITATTDVVVFAR
jgi:hypothetical protein